MKVGMLSDNNGNFEVTLPKGKNQLHISYVGYITQVLQAKNGMRVMLKEDAAALDEVVCRVPKGDSRQPAEWQTGVASCC